MRFWLDEFGLRRNHELWMRAFNELHPKDKLTMEHVARSGLNDLPPDSVLNVNSRVAALAHYYVEFRGRSSVLAPSHPRYQATTAPEHAKDEYKKYSAGLSSSSKADQVKFANLRKAPREDVPLETFRPQRRNFTLVFTSPGTSLTRRLCSTPRGASRPALDLNIPRLHLRASVCRNCESIGARRRDIARTHSLNSRHLDRYLKKHVEWTTHHMSLPVTVVGGGDTFIGSSDICPDRRLCDGECLNRDVVAEAFVQNVKYDEPCKNVRPMGQGVKSSYWVRALTSQHDNLTSAPTRKDQRPSPLLCSYMAAHTGRVEKVQQLVDNGFSCDWKLKPSIENYLFAVAASVSAAYVRRRHLRAYGAYEGAYVARPEPASF